MPKVSYKKIQKNTKNNGGSTGLSDNQKLIDQYKEDIGNLMQWLAENFCSDFVFDAIIDVIMRTQQERINLLTDANKPVEEA